MVGYVVRKCVFINVLVFIFLNSFLLYLVIENWKNYKYKNVKNDKINLK